MGHANGERQVTCLVAGRPNAGKTLLTLRLAAFLGMREIRLQRNHPVDGTRSAEWQETTYTLEQARRELVRNEPHNTLAPQRVSLNLSQPVWLVDTPALPDGIHAHPAVRRGAAAVMRALLEADVVLHVIDAPATGDGTVLADADQRLAAFASGRVGEGYLAVANKVDRPRGHAGLSRIEAGLAPHKVLAVSAMTGKGLPEIRNHLLNYLSRPASRQVF